jgi:hypothetical protein
MAHHRPFYGKQIIRREERERIERLVAKYRDEPASDLLCQKIYDELMWQKHLGEITIPFQVVLNRGSGEGGVDYIEILLESKV